MSKTLSIGEVAKQSGLQTSAIRYYESEGLLPEPQRVNGRRRYDDAVFQRLALIQLMRQAGFGIADLRTLLVEFPANTPPSTRWQHVAVEKLGEVEAIIRQMQALKGWLNTAMTCECATIDDCATYLPDADQTTLTCGSSIG